MLEVIITPTGDRGEADSPEAAVLAARVLLAEARTAGCGHPTAAFFCDGQFVRAGVRRP